MLRKFQIRLALFFAALFTALIAFLVVGVQIHQLLDAPDGALISSSWQGQFPVLIALAVSALLVAAIGAWALVRGVLQLEHQTMRDAVTGLPNRTAFERRLRTAVKQAALARKPLSVHLLQIGRFSEINHTFGHVTGDKLIAQAGGILRRLVPPSSMVARHSSGIFALLLSDSAMPERAGQFNPVVARILEAFDEPMHVDGNTIDVTAWMGEARYPRHGRDERMLLQRADTAIYQAKQASQRHALYDARNDPYKPERLSLMGELRHGLEHGEFRLHYQAKIDLNTEKIIAAEALIRWKHPVRGPMLPDEFIPLAEQTGNIHKLTSWMLNAVIAQVADWHRRGIHIKVALNLSARDLGNRDLPRELSRLLKQHGVNINQLILEITESAVMQDPRKSMRVLSALSQMGAALSIDDYGTGYSSLSYLKSLPVQEIKIDKSFVLRLSTSKGDEILVRSTIDLGRNLGLKVSAEGVEDRAALEILKQYDCDVGQGFYISKPLPVSEFEALYLRSRWSPSNTVLPRTETMSRP